MSLVDGDPADEINLREPEGHHDVPSLGTGRSTVEKRITTELAIMLRYWWDDLDVPALLARLARVRKMVCRMRLNFGKLIAKHRPIARA